MSIPSKVAILQRLSHHFWALACRDAGVSPNSLFVVFQQDNIHANHHDRVIELICRLHDGRQRTRRIP